VSVEAELAAVKFSELDVSSPLGWHPTRLGLIADLERMDYSAKSMSSGLLSLGNIANWAA